MPIIRYEVTYLRSAALLLVAFAVASTAEAQIYTWRDANGRAVYSDRVPSETPNELQTYLVPNTTEPVLTDKPVAGDYRGSYDDMIVRHARTQNLRPDLVRAVVQVESGYNPRAISPKGALGLMQLMPSTAARLGVVRPFDPEESIRGGTAYLRQLLDRFDGDETLALAAYNAGPQAVDRYGNKVPPYRETRDYVRRVKNQTPLAAAPPPKPPTLIYKTVEVVNGRTIVRYSDTRPASGPYEVIRNVR
jgi:soluble lytic murein transglycosylase-like protein